MDFIVKYTRCAIFCYTICSTFIIPNILFAMPFVPLSFIV